MTGRAYYIFSTVVLLALSATSMLTAVYVLHSLLLSMKLSQANPYEKWLETLSNSFAVLCLFSLYVVASIVFMYLAFKTADRVFDD
ncbi:MAG: hypothetical protein QW734_08515 [Candidatus Bathyarchaeia archaeon]